jgi:hypothetical protein
MFNGCLSWALHIHSRTPASATAGGGLQQSNRVTTLLRGSEPIILRQQYK